MNPGEAKIGTLMEVFSCVDSSLRQFEYLQQLDSWHPATEKERAAFDALTAVENRAALKVWYSSFPSINPVADKFRHILERAIGEELPLKQRQL